MNTAVSGVPRVLLRLEGIAVLATCLVAYRALGGSWLLFAALFLVPDLSMVGYLRGRRTGAAIYNVVHWYVAPAVLAGLMAIGLITPHWWICLIWVSHIGFDRGVGYGLKFTSAFRDTHLSVSTVSGE